MCDTSRKSGVAALIKQQPHTSLVIGQREGKEGAIVTGFEVLADYGADLGIFSLWFLLVLADQRLAIIGGEPLQQFAQLLRLDVAGRNIGHPGDSLQLQPSTIVERNGTTFEGQHRLRAIDNNLQQALEPERGSDLGADMNQGFENLQLALGMHQAGVLERAAHRLRHAVHEEQVVIGEARPTRLVDGLEHAQLALAAILCVLDERHQERIGDRRASSGTRLRVANRGSSGSLINNGAPSSAISPT